MTTPTNPNQGTIAGSLYMIIACLCFALMFTLIKLAGMRFNMHSYELTFWRVVFGLIVLGGLAWIQGRDFTTIYPKQHFWRSFAGTLALVMNFYAVIHLPLATASTLNNTSALFLALLSFIFLRQRLSILAWTSLVLGFFGVILLLRPALMGVDMLPLLIGLASGVLSGYAYLQVRELSLLGEPVWRIVFYFSLLASIMTGAVSWWVGFTPLNSGIVSYVLGIGMTALIGQLMMTYAYQVGRKFVVATLSYLTVAMTVVLGVWVFGDELDMFTLLGIAIIATAGILSGR